MSTQWGAPYPSLHLWPLQDTFSMKMIHLPEGLKVKIGRQTNNKTVPGERNAYFDSKVLSRTHAEIFYSDGKIFIKDLKSSNGTFVNNDRLSPEGVESEAFELKSEDIVEFGIDIVSDDNRTIVHHKVAARAYCVFGPEDAQFSAREMPYEKRPAAAPTSSGGKPPALSFDHVLQRLQAELAKSKETGADLQGLTSAMTDIQDTLGGGLPPAQNGSSTDYIPAEYRSTQSALDGPHGQQAAAFITLQNQLADTQATLNEHLEKIRQLEKQLEEHRVRGAADAAETKTHLEELISRRPDWDDDGASTSSTITVTELQTEVADVVEKSNTLSSRHDQAKLAVDTLTERLDTLEDGIASRVAEEVGKVEQRWEIWRTRFEESRNEERATWEAEREKLQQTVRDWEAKTTSRPKSVRKRRRRPSKTISTSESDSSVQPIDPPTMVDRRKLSCSLSDSDKHIIDTLKEPDKLREGRKPIQVPIFTVIIVAVIAGALYYKHKE